MPSECLSSDTGCTSCTSQLCDCRPIKEKHSVVPGVLSVVTQLAPPNPTTQSSSNQPRSSRHHSHQQTITIQSPSPLTDITRLRVRPQPHYCLYPGARFEGSQKSGLNSYEVAVTLTDIDLGSSHLCGYLSIKGLTDDYPELTTYFDADVIGEQHGFRTENWGATEGDDITHWNRFPAFRHVRSEMKRPRLTIPDRDRGAVFMRWKEKFLVPDHRVQDINGASFAGFYYVCIDFNPPAPSPATSSSRRREPSPRPGPVNPTMNGFYYHKNFEPYQQLSLSYVPERYTSAFEFR